MGFRGLGLRRPQALTPERLSPGRTSRRRFAPKSPTERCKRRVVNGLLDLGRMASDFSTLVLTRVVDL
jgi:hypothetical protein